MLKSHEITIPGMLDPHVHLRGMEWEEKGTFLSGTQRALHGGYPMVLDMPNTPPETVTCDKLDYKLAQIDRQTVTDYGIYWGATPDNMGEGLRVIESICGIKIYCNATTGTLLVDNPDILEAHFYNWTNHKPIAVHAEEDKVPLIIGLVRKYRRPTYFCHVSTQDEIKLLEAAKREGLPIYVEVTPHHLLLNENDFHNATYPGLYTVKPSLKSPADNAALWQAIKSGVVDTIGTDTAPHTWEEKTSANPPSGIPGFETALPLLFAAFNERGLEIDRLTKLVSTNPRKIFGIKESSATYTVIDLEVSYHIDPSHMHLHPCSPFVGMTARGQIREVWIRGTQVYDGENILVSPGFGQNLFG